MRCPICNGRTSAAKTPGLLLCGQCGELLAPEDTVKRATKRTRRVYVTAHPNQRTEESDHA